MHCNRILSALTLIVLAAFLCTQGSASVVGRPELLRDDLLREARWVVQKAGGDVTGDPDVFPSSDRWFLRPLLTFHPDKSVLGDYSQRDSGFGDEFRPRVYALLSIRKTSKEKPWQKAARKFRIAWERQARLDPDKLAFIAFTSPDFEKAAALKHDYERRGYLAFSYQPDARGVMPFTADEVAKFLRMTPLHRRYLVDTIEARLAKGTNIEGFENQREIDPNYLARDTRASWDHARAAKPDQSLESDFTAVKSEPPAERRAGPHAGQRSSPDPSDTIMKSDETAEDRLRQKYFGYPLDFTLPADDANRSADSTMTSDSYRMKGNSPEKAESKGVDPYRTKGNAPLGAEGKGANIRGTPRPKLAPEIIVPLPRPIVKPR